MLSVRELRELRLNLAPNQSAQGEVDVEPVEEILHDEGPLHFVLAGGGLKDAVHFLPQNLYRRYAVRLALEKHRDVGSPALAKLASPVAHLDKDDPPLLLLHGTDDPQRHPPRLADARLHGAVHSRAASPPRS